MSTRHPLPGGEGVAAALFLILLFISPAFAQNLVKNGNFEGGLNAQGEPVGWHTRLTSIIPVPEYKDPEHKAGRTGVVHFKCGCGYDWGTVRPFATLVCPKCGHMITGLEDAGDWYNKNHEYVSLIDGAQGKGLGFKLSTDVGNMQGVRALSDLIPAHRGEGYEFKVDVITRGSSARLFVEGFQLDRDADNIKEVQAWLKTLPPGSNPLHLTAPLKRVFRQQINGQSPPTWTTVSERFANEEPKPFDYMFVSLYGYIPGEVGFDNVVLRRLTDQELAAWRKDNPPPPAEGEMR